VIQHGPRRLDDGLMALREISLEDTRDLFLWRQQERLQTLFHSTGAASYEQHEAFVARYFEPGNPDCWFVIEVEGRPAGAVALYRSGPGDSWEAGRIVLAPELRGFKGFRHAKRAIALLMEFARAAGHAHLRCEVLEDNRVMRGIVTSLGFRETGAGERHGRPYRELTAPLV
jgi:RimJ/RimL family protein N-acetyltransferase